MNYAYVLLADHHRLQCPVRVSTHLLRQLDPHTDIVVLVPQNVHMI